MSCEICDKFWNRINNLKDPIRLLEKLQMIIKIDEDYDMRFGRPTERLSASLELYIYASQRKQRYIHYKMGEIF